MARPLRIELAGGLYHVTSRGNARHDIFLDDDDRLCWLEIFCQVCERFNWVCHAYCLMTNHYHIVIETIEGNLSAGMRQLNGVYTQSFNRRHQRVGHVYQGRFKGILVEKESYLLELSRYVVLNPVRALMVSLPGQWKWSSYNAMIDSSIAPPKWLQTDWLLGQFSLTRTHAIIQYLDFVNSGVGLPPIWQNLRNQIYLGNKDFVLQLQSNLKGNSELINEIPKTQRRPPAEPLEFYKNNYQNRKEGMRLAFKTGDFTLQQIATIFGVHYSTVSRTVK